MEKLEPRQKAVVLVGHGAIPKDYPRDLVTRLKALEAKRRLAGGEPSPEEIDLERKIRNWPRTAASDPYRTGLESLAERLKPLLKGALLSVAYNEFCAPTLEEAAVDLMHCGANDITVLPSMLTPGGVHSEEEIPAALERLRVRHPSVRFHYVWPFDLVRVAEMLADHLEEERNRNPDR
jgi:sirohydrochlorin cobaltochelatase